MAATAKMATRALRATPLASTIRPAARRVAVPRQAFQRQARRGYASETPKPSAGSNTALIGGIAAVALAGIGYYALGGNPEALKQGSTAQGQKGSATFSPSNEDYQKVYDFIAKKLIDEDDYDDGSYGPVLLRLGWHASGTYDKETGTGGSNGATMRFPPEGDHGANAGLFTAREFLEPVKKAFPWISYSDLWTLGAACAIQEMGGPDIKWRPGRADRDISYCTPDGRLPDASQGNDHLRAIFHRMGFNDQDIVTLSGAHALGRCHTDRSGFEGPWTFSPITLTNDYFKLLLSERWQHRKWAGPVQFEDNKTKSIMMLPTDVALVKDKAFRPVVERYAKDQDAFFADFSRVCTQLFELGVPFAAGEESRIAFKRTE